LQTTGDIIVRNNIIESATGKQIHIYYNNSTNVQVYNNTLIGRSSPYHLMEFTDGEDVSPYQKLNIKNNILYQSGSNTSLLKFREMGEDDIKQINILNNNLYYITPSATPKIYFEPDIGPAYSRDWNYNDWWETEGKNADPLFVNVSNDNFKLNYNSPSKNSGITFNLEKDFYGNDRSYWPTGAFDIGAHELPDAHVKIGRPSENYTTNIEAMSPVLIRSGSSWEESYSTSLTHLSFTTTDHCGNTNKEYWDGISFKWLHQGTSDPNSPAGIGLYKFELDQSDPPEYFYLDDRDANYSITYNPNIYLKYENGNYKYWDGSGFTNISNGEILRSWEILNQTPSYNSIWTNILAVFPKFNEQTDEWEPYLDWRPYSGFTTDKYRIYFAIDGSGFSQLGEVNASTFSYQHTGMSLGTQEGAYYVEAISEGLTPSTIQTNIVYIGVGGEYKKAVAKRINSGLEQNYPNPFNPSTYIKYSVASIGPVSLKVYDLLGREVKTLVDETKEPGIYEVMFSPTDLASGIYVYRLRVNDYTISKKMQFVK
jgi:hypothetical protein